MSHFKSRLSLMVLVNVVQHSGPVTTATIPYIRDTSETIARILQPCNIRVAHKPITTLRRLLTNVKDKDSRAVYTLLISLGAIFNFQQMTSFAERSYTWPKWLPKTKALLTLILQYVHVKKKNVFTLYQEEYFLYVFMGMLS